MVPWKIATNWWQLVVYPMFIHSHFSDSLQHIQRMYLPVIQATQNAKVQGFLWTSLLNLCWDRHIWFRTPSINLEPLWTSTEGMSASSQLRGFDLSKASPFRGSMGNPLLCNPSRIFRNAMCIWVCQNNFGILSHDENHDEKCHFSIWIIFFINVPIKMNIGVWIHDESSFLICSLFKWPVKTSTSACLIPGNPGPQAKRIPNFSFNDDLIRTTSARQGFLVPRDVG